MESTAIDDVPLSEVLTKYQDTENWFNYESYYKQVALEPGFFVFVELGSWKGHSVAFLANELKKLDRRAVIFAVDLWDKLPKTSDFWEKYPEQMPIIYDIYSHNLSRMGVRDMVNDIRRPTAEAAAFFDDGTVDFIFVDAAHDEASVSKDIRAWWPKLRMGGVMSGHDFCCESVHKAVHGFDFDGNTKMEFENRDIWAVCKKSKYNVKGEN
jgi:hypothetical protein